MNFYHDRRAGCAGKRTIHASYVSSISHCLLPSIWQEEDRRTWFYGYGTGEGLWWAETWKFLCPKTSDRNKWHMDGDDRMQPDFITRRDWKRRQAAKRKKDNPALDNVRLKASPKVNQCRIMAYCGYRRKRTKSKKIHPGNQRSAVRLSVAPMNLFIERGESPPD